MIKTHEVSAMVSHVQVKLPARFNHIPDGWRNALELALIDAVLSIRARYGTSADTGVRGAIGRYRAAFPDREPWNDLRSLTELDPIALAEVLDNRQVTGGVLKAEAIVNAAGRLVNAGATRADDVEGKKHKAAYTGTRGLGPITWSYLLILLGHEGVKADVHVSCFVAQAIGREASADEVAALVTEAAQQLEVPSNVLDHAIWRHMSATRKN